MRNLHSGIPKCNPSSSISAGAQLLAAPLLHGWMFACPAHCLWLLLPLQMGTALHGSAQTFAAGGVEGLERDSCKQPSGLWQVLGNPTKPHAGVRVWAAIHSVKPPLSHGRISTCKCWVRTATSLMKAENVVGRMSKGLGEQ